MWHGGDCVSGFDAANQSSRVSITQMARKRKSGRKRKYPAKAGSKLRVRQHRRRLVPKSGSQRAWDRYLDAIGLTMARGMRLSDAPPGQGELLTGGMDFSRLSNTLDRL